MDRHRAQPQLRSGEMSEKTLGILLVLPAVLLMVVLIIIPLMSAIHASFYDVRTTTREYRYVGLENYRWLLKGDLFLPSLWRTIEWTVSNVVAQVVLAVVTALVLNMKLRGRSLVRGIALFPYVVPTIVATLAWRFSLNDAVGIINFALTKVGLAGRPIIWLGNPDIALWTTVAINIWKYTPWMMVIFLARLQVIPQELYEAARVDGASKSQEFWYVTLPWLWPAIIVAMLLRTIFVSTEFDLIYLLAFGGPLHATTTLPVLIRNVAIEHFEAGRASAVSVVLAGLLMLIAWLYLRAYGRVSARLE